jgi:hypothetical protein
MDHEHQYRNIAMLLMYDNLFGSKAYHCHLYQTKTKAVSLIYFFIPRNNQSEGKVLLIVASLLKNQLGLF